MGKWLGGTLGCTCLALAGALLVVVLIAVLILGLLQAVYATLFGGAVPETIHGTPANGVITATFMDPDYYEQFGVPHTGIDIANAAGTPVYCTVDDGIVDRVGYDPDGYGIYVRLKDDDSDWYVIYAHLQSVAPGVYVGADDLEWGDLVGTMDSTGNSTGDHLHYEIQTPDGTPVNPETSEGCCG